MHCTIKTTKKNTLNTNRYMHQDIAVGLKHCILLSKNIDFNTYSGVMSFHLNNNTNNTTNLKITTRNMNTQKVQTSTKAAHFLYVTYISFVLFKHTLEIVCFYFRKKKCKVPAFIIHPVETHFNVLDIILIIVLVLLFFTSVVMWHSFYCLIKFT